MKKKLVMIICLSLLLLLPNAVASAAEISYISDITLERGNSGAAEEFERNGYTLLYPLFTGETYVGYKTTFSQSGAMTGIAYEGGKLVGIAGTGRSPVVGVYYLSSGDSMPLPNNGGLPVTDKSGKVLELDAGDSVGYLIYMPKDNFKPYISDVKVAKAGSKKAAVEDLIGQGCEYYVDENYSSDGDVVVLGYSRTDDEKDAVTDIVGLGEEDAAPEGYEQVSGEKIAGHILYKTKDESCGNPLCDIEDFEEAEDTQISSKVLADMRLSKTDAMSKQYIMAEGEYEKACDSAKTYMLVGMDTSDGEDTGIALITEEDGFENKRVAKRERLMVGAGAASGAGADVEADEEQPAEEMQTEAPQTEDGEQVEQPKSDEVADTDKSNFDTPSEDAEAEVVADQTTEENVEGTDQENSDAQQGTVLRILGGTGATVFFLVLIGISVVIPVGMALYKRHMEKVIEREKESKE